MSKKSLITAVSTAAMVATMLDAFFPTAPFPDGNWVRETVEA